MVLTSTPIWIYYLYIPMVRYDNMEARQQRGMEIAATTRIVKKGDQWAVPSQSLNGKYTVTKNADGYQCTCPDHELRQIKCKHAFAVEFAMKREYHADR